MCGIAGYFGAHPPTNARITACENLMIRRGPDSRDRHQFELGDGNTVVLLHSRLSIIDLDPRANQPMRRGKQVIAMNGELYNYLELRRSLRSQGVAFHTNSDTEVMIAGIQNWGLDKLLDQGEGMWAFAMLDENERTLTLARDRFGEKPLYLMSAGSGLYFGSEPKFLFALAGIKPFVNHNHLIRYLVNGYKALYKVKDNFFDNLRELSPGTYATFKGDGSVLNNRYWSWSIQPDEKMSFNDSVEIARDALLNAVGLRLRADVPLAFCLSGGVDSNAIVSIAKRIHDFDVHGFTIISRDARYDEQELVDSTVSELGIRHTSIPLSTEGFLENLSSLVIQHDAPIYTISYYVHWLLMNAISEAGYRIALSGTAADELFTGYYDHHNAYLYEIYSDPNEYDTALASWQKYVRPIVRNPYLKNPNLFVEDPAFRDHIYLNSDVFSKALIEPWSEPFEETQYTTSLLRNRMLNELFHESVPVILHEDDNNAMHCSIENRSPFLDRKLFEITNQIPSRHLIQDGKAKAVLREAIRGIAPNSIVDNRRKVGFNASINELLDTNDTNIRAQILDDGPIFELVRRDAIEELLRKTTLENSESKFLFNFISSRIFLECASSFPTTA